MWEAPPWRVPGPHSINATGRRGGDGYFNSVYFTGGGSEAQRRQWACRGHSARHSCPRPGSSPRADPEVRIAGVEQCARGAGRVGETGQTEEAQS